ncbi:MAG: hypothetical protein K940chlam3_00511 [Chlamydiae bacterium]|nr:hypothetical protein [Chlamydiota bacterium]
MLRKTKRHILLLEVLIALALVALCAFPLLAPQLMMIRSERLFLDEIESDRIANIIFVNIAQQMYQNRITWEQLQNREAVPVGQDLLKGVTLTKNWPYEMTYRFGKPQTKPSGKPPQFALFPVWITMTPKEGKPLNFFYELFVEKEQELVVNEEE